MDINIALIETGNHLLASNNVKDGVKIGAKSVDIAVIVIDNAVFPFAKYVITFEAVQPGQQPTKITPTAISGGNLNTVARPKAIAGIIVYCTTTPNRTLFGAFTTRLKSSVVNVKPIPNIMIPSNKEICGAIQLNPFGIKNASVANIIIQIANVFPATVLILSKTFIFFPPLKYET